MLPDPALMRVEILRHLSKETSKQPTHASPFQWPDEAKLLAHQTLTILSKRCAAVARPVRIFHAFGVEQQNNGEGELEL